VKNMNNCPKERGTLISCMKFKDLEAARDSQSVNSWLLVVNFEWGQERPSKDCLATKDQKERKDALLTDAPKLVGPS
jgi:hypothetical protein